MAEKGEKKSEKYLYIEPKKHYEKRKRFEYFSCFTFPILLIIITILLILYFNIYLGEKGDPIVPFLIALFFALFIIIWEYYFSIKPMHRFIIYLDGLKSEIGNNFYYFSDIKSYKILYNTIRRNQLIVYFINGNYEVYSGIPTGLEIKKIKKAFRKKGFR